MLEKGIHRLLMDGSEDQGRRCPVSQQFTEEDIGLGMSVPGIIKLSLAGKGVGFQPVQQLGAIGADDSHLRIMDMSIDEARGYQGILIVDDLDLRRQ